MPRLLLLDDPFSAVDQMNRQGLYRLLADLRAELSIPIVLVTHDLNEARMLADRLVVLDAGKVLRHGSPAHIQRAPRNARVADLVADPEPCRFAQVDHGDPGMRPSCRASGHRPPACRVRTTRARCEASWRPVV